ncbi:L-threonine 3-dehydrogenase [Streptomyces rimosus subsp. rimosus]
MCSRHLRHRPQRAGGQVPRRAGRGDGARGGRYRRYQEAGAAVTAHKPGDRVAINPTSDAGSCPPCLRGHWDFCANKAGTEVGLDLDGAFAEFIRLPERFVHAVPEGMDFDRAVGVEPLACVLNNVEAGRLRAGETAVIVGGGPVGVVCAMAAHYYGARVLLTEPDPYRQELCREVFAGDFGGRVTVRPPDDPDLAGRGDVVIDTVGNLLEQSMAYAATRGRVVVMGYNSKASATVRPLEILQRGLQIIGAGDYNSRLFPRAIELARWLPLERLVTHRFPLERHEEAFAALAAAPGSPYSALKVGSYRSDRGARPFRPVEHLPAGRAVAAFPAGGPSGEVDGCQHRAGDEESVLDPDGGAPGAVARGVGDAERGQARDRGEHQRHLSRARQRPARPVAAVRLVEDDDREQHPRDGEQREAEDGEHPQGRLGGRERVALRQTGGGGGWCG